MKKFIAALTASIFIFAQGFAQDALTESPQATLVLTMTIEDGALTGPGADVINDKLEKAQFILIGEDHGFAGPPQIARAIAKAAWPYGLRYHVVEAGPLRQTGRRTFCVAAALMGWRQLWKGARLHCRF